MICSSILKYSSIEWLYRILEWLYRILPYSHFPSKLCRPSFFIFWHIIGKVRVAWFLFLCNRLLHNFSWDFRTMLNRFGDVFIHCVLNLYFSWVCLASTSGTVCSIWIYFLYELSFFLIFYIFFSSSFWEYLKGFFVHRWSDFSALTIPCPISSKDFNFTELFFFLDIIFLACSALVLFLPLF